MPLQVNVQAVASREVGRNRHSTIQPSFSLFFFFCCSLHGFVVTNAVRLRCVELFWLCRGHGAAESLLGWLVFIVFLFSVDFGDFFLYFLLVWACGPSSCGLLFLSASKSVFALTLPLGPFCLCAGLFIHLIWKMTYILAVGIYAHVCFRRSVFVSWSL